MWLRKPLALPVAHALTRIGPPPPPLLRHADNPVPDKDDSAPLIAARQLETSYLKSWIAAFHEERAAAKAFLAREARAAHTA